MQTGEPGSNPMDQSKEASPDFWKKTKAAFERMDPESAKKLLAGLGFTDKPYEEYQRGNFEHDLYMQYPGNAAITMEGIVAVQGREGQQAEDQDHLTVDLLVKSPDNQSHYSAADPEKSPYWAKYQEVLDALKQEGSKQVELN